MDRRKALAALSGIGLVGLAEDVASAAPAPAVKDPDDVHRKFVEECYKEIRKLSRSVETRKELLEKFKPAGGLYNRKLQSFSYIRCPWFKVSVTFEPADGDKDGKPEDKVVKVATPYLEDPFAE